MKKTDSTRRKLLMASLGAIATQFDAGEAAAQDAAKVMPKAYRVALDNDQVRVLEFIGRPGMGICGDGMHSHPAHLTIVMADWTGLVTTPDGKVQKRERKQGDVFWSEGETHKLENTGATSSRVMIVELKTPAKPRT